mgnify:CR=1 FL=1
MLGAISEFVAVGVGFDGVLRGCITGLRGVGVGALSFFGPGGRVGIEVYVPVFNEGDEGIERAGGGTGVAACGFGGVDFFGGVTAAGEEARIISGDEVTVLGADDDFSWLDPPRRVLNNFRLNFPPFLRGEGREPELFEELGLFGLAGNISGLSALLGGKVTGGGFEIRFKFPEEVARTGFLGKSVGFDGITGGFFGITGGFFGNAGEALGGLGGGAPTKH